MAWRVGCGAVASSAGWGPLRDPSGTLPGIPAAFGPRGTLPAPRSAVLPATYEEICVSGARGSAFFRPPAALGLRPGPCCLLGRGLRSAPWSVGVPGHVLAGLVWLCVRLFFGCWVCSVCAWFMASQGSPGRRSPLGDVRWPRSVAGAVWPGRPFAGGRPLAAGKTPNICPEVAGESALGVPFCGRSRYAAQAGRSHRTAPARGGARQRPINSTIENTITRLSYG